jgi:hypothetical protein
MNSTIVCFNVKNSRRVISLITNIIDITKKFISSRNNNASKHPQIMLSGLVDENQEQTHRTVLQE